MILGLSGVSKQFGIDIVLENISFRIESREKVALVGRNGAGKTTLLKIITGQYEPDSGSINLPRGVKVGYLRQESPITSGITVLQEAEKGVARQLELKSRLAELESIIAEHPTDEDLDEYSRILEHFSDSDAFSAERDVEQILNHMGFFNSDFEKITDSLSGGEKTRLALAKILLEEPDLLILDEPTNHLDLQATEWLEEWIKSYHGAVLIVSHDRVFLQNTVRRVLEIRQHKIKDFPGNYEQYRRLRAEEDARLVDMAAKQAAEAAKLDEFVRRFMNSQRTAQARGRQKMLHRLLENRIEIPSSERSMAGQFNNIKRSGEMVLECENLSVGFVDETLYSGLNWTVRWQERWGIIGENGAGKSTLIRTALGKIPAVEGSSRIGRSVDLAYFSQDTAVLDLEDTPISFIMDETDLEAGPARDLLGKFLFHGDDVFRQIKTLSGGEKNKLVLASLIHASPNLLILDEPTNHLDIDSREALSQMLSEYPGTLILISHDRWLLSQVANNILDVRRSGPLQFIGGYEEYRDRQKNINSSDTNSPSTKSISIQEKAPEPVNQYELSKEIGRIVKAISEAEKEVETQENVLKEIESNLSNPNPSQDVIKLTHDYQATQAQLENSISNWEQLIIKQEQLESLRG